MFIEFLLFLLSSSITFIGSWYGLEIYASMDQKSIEDTRRDEFIFVWFIISLILSFCIIISGSVVYFLIPWEREIIAKSFLIGGSVFAVITNACGWDLTTRSKTSNEEYTRRTYIIMTLISIVLFLYSCYSMENWIHGKIKL